MGYATTCFLHSFPLSSWLNQGLLLLSVLFQKRRLCEFQMFVTSNFRYQAMAIADSIPYSALSPMTHTYTAMYAYHCYGHCMPSSLRLSTSRPQLAGPNHSHTEQDRTLCVLERALPTELLRQISWLGRITHTQSKTEHSVF